MKYDVIIIGAGPAGLSAAIYSARGGLKTAIFEKAMVGGQINVTDEVENYPGFEEPLSGFELTAKMHAQAERFGARFIEEEITAMGMEGLCKVIETDSGKYRAKSVIICTGAHPRRLNIPGEERLTGRGVSYCATCDGALYRDKVVAVVGGGDSAIEEGIFLSRFARKVIVIHRRDELRAQKIIQDRAFKNPKMEFIWDTVVQEIHGEERVGQLELVNRKSKEISMLPVDGVFIYVGILPNNELLESRIELDSAGFVLTDDHMHTNIPGIYAAGDIRHTVLRQVVTATSDGAVAAWSAEKWIIENYDALEVESAK
ncbi:MAG: thioredoxin-disulfide reductase [Candidatus Cloacimonadales bacterium]|jgi:thioredoxin reductase (NADPH)|nr:thioredoxin-disulfide reductase [Candidatus Cloacimonadota bacterium]MDY0381213.1 thioredoxin-disulfide reductase [Candidatus Cloacimonadaceae bacterium]MCB5277743.1 thioredoxin-disulfide reductase [Candidatus Cloacimonadota bacterium]MCK9434931.1 thioredoxin-disulfide reductase [Candidatus Cloacimonadota bacterium]MDD2615674.1 thioredoxin-disulfide reductase [Candidatus Cloacimonadota bacterium]